MARKTTLQVERFKVLLRGIRPLMFDPYPGDNNTTLPIEQKFYFAADGKTLTIPCQNILSMLGSTTYPCAAKILHGKTYAPFAAAAAGFVDILPMRVPILDGPKGKPIRFNGFSNGRFREDRSTARVKKGGLVIPNPKVRPVLELPWFLQLDVEILPNDKLDGPKLRALFDAGGLYIGVGTWRGRYGKFVVDEWIRKNCCG